VSSFGPLPGADPGPLRDLPLNELPVKSPGAWMAVIFSGDGGWRDIDKQIGETLASRGAPVVGIDSLRYFWRAKQPEQVAADLSRILRHYAARWGTRQVVLAGYSFGAGIVPFAYNRLPEEDRAKVVQLSLLGLGPRAPFEFRVGGWLRDVAYSDAPLVLPELRRIELGRVQCFYGADEPDSLCPVRDLDGVERVRTSGGHHFDGDYAALAARIADGVALRAGRAPTPP
jgi:type IV secretory pathway VirJ component